MNVTLTDKEAILVINLVEAELWRMKYENQEAYVQSTHVLLDKLTATGIGSLQKGD